MSTRKKVPSPETMTVLGMFDGTIVFESCVFVLFGKPAETNNVEVGVTNFSVPRGNKNVNLPLSTRF